MAKKKREEVVSEPQVIENPRLTYEQYWEWRTTIAELEIAKKSQEIANLTLSAAKKDADILALKAQVFSLTQLKTAEKDVKEAQEEYTITKNRLEALLNISLNDKVIDAATLEVKSAT